VAARPRILAVFHDGLYPANMGNRVRNVGILEALSRDFDLTIVTLAHCREQMSEPGPVAELGRWHGVLAAHRQNRLAWLMTHLRERATGLRSGLRPALHFQSLPELSRRVLQLIESEKPDIVHSAYWFTLRHVRHKPRPPLWVVDTHDVQFERLDRLFGGARPSERTAELEALRTYDRIIAITGRDRDTFRRHLGESSPPIDVIPMGLDLRRWDPAVVDPLLPPAPRVSFYGTLSTGVNQEAARHFLDDLVPELRRRREGLEFWLLGAGAPPDLEARAHASGARLAGYQPDIRPALASAGVLALSLRSGTGQRGRVVEAVALGVPVVAYHGALEGLEIGEEQGVFGVSTEREFCDRVIELLDSRPRWAHRQPQIRRDLEEAYGWEATYGRFPRLYRQLLDL